MHGHMPCSTAEPSGRVCSSHDPTVCEAQLDSSRCRPHLKTDTTLAWQLKPKTMMGMANSACMLPSLISWQAAGPSNSDATMHGGLQIAVA